MILDLPRPFASRYGIPIVDRVDTAIFHERYFVNCMDCGFCFDSCCQYGADVDGMNIARLTEAAPRLSAYTGIPPECFLKAELLADDDYPSGTYTRTQVANGACVFLNRQGRGCRIHSFCLDEGLDYHDLKPMVCSLFPITFDKGLMRQSYEIIERDLACIDQGPTVYDGVRDEVRYYFGDELVAVLDGLRQAPADPA